MSSQGLLIFRVSQITCYNRGHTLGFTPPQICTYSSWTQVIPNFRLILRARNIICTTSSRLGILSMWIQLVNSPDFYLYLYMYISEFVLYFIITYFKFHMLTLFSSMKDQLYVHVTYNSVDWKQLLLLNIAVRVLIYSELQTFRKLLRLQRQMAISNDIYGLCR